MIIANVSRVFIFFISAGLYKFLLTKTIPQITLKHKSVGENTKDRGIKKYTFEDGRAVIYEPEFEFRGYVSQYMLFSKNNNKYIRCRVNTCVRHLRYDVIAYNNKHKVLDVVGVEERLNNQKYTESVLLPPETSYVRFVLRCVDDMFYSNKVRVKYSKTSIGVCVGLITLATIALGLVVNACFKDLWQLLIFEALPARKVIVQAGIVGAIASVFIIKTYAKKNVKVTNK